MGTGESRALIGETPLIKSYECRRGRGLSKRARWRWHNLLPQFSLPFDPATASVATWRQWGASRQNIALEIGFGSGDSFVRLTQHHPDTSFIGAEPFRQGVSRLLRLLEESDASPHRITIYPHDGRQLLYTMPDDFLDGLFVFFPDPWRKTRHHKRRLINATFLRHAHRVLAAGGGFHVASDHASYLLQIGRLCRRHGGFERLSPRGRAARKCPSFLQESRYWQKACAMGRTSLFFSFATVKTQAFADTARGWHQPVHS